jgi:hypothetical protein
LGPTKAKAKEVFCFPQLFLSTTKIGIFWDFFGFFLVYISIFFLSGKGGGKVKGIFFLIFSVEQADK